MSANVDDIAKRSLQLTEAQWGTLIRTMEGGRGPLVPATLDRRNLDMQRYKMVRRAALRVQHPAGNVTSHLVRTRNLSAGGLSILHGCFLYPRTMCHVALQTRHGESVAIAAAVQWCRHVSGKSHELGLCFSRMIQVDEFIDPKDMLNDQAA